MKKWSSLFEDSISQKHRKSVLSAARSELAQNGKQREKVNLTLSWLATAAGIGGLTWFGLSKKKSENGTSVDGFDQDGFLEADLDLLEDLDMLEDLDILIDDEMDEWT